MKALLLKYATPFIAGLFLVSLVSGVALFFHVGNATFHGMHEWLSMVLILPFVLHLWKNWKPLFAYLSGAPMAIALVASVALALPFATGQDQGGRGGGPPQIVVARALAKSSPAQVAPALGMQAEQLVARLVDSGFTAASVDLSLAEIASRSAKDEQALMAVLAGATRPQQ
ncbi:DUF4405 domain-containing protein [Rhizobium binae]|uniref:DUF4405 domain-containing protein n=1 Tax=Rhizobium binae TaxID=1138190 RepID=A0ABV2MDP2_9HYPH|nr:DUF4405 domain-containing protein [Rhizobium binae]NKL50770.1 DUF4405 domain-containing protein [Rhizobium leguminosarum bv. viciae]MBX4929072.1 DUF4405 domain-containing protein [Rhizobium binae]MBX4941918.1 DUF4405 domain-containing protein [Rhizobium binae]MBX4947933.1 DUF4405 domain-containing protein [Rhizobium binae]MBX4953525.1 DUF4405 domain-containing protein [Rhizobium binae]